MKKMIGILMLGLLGACTVEHGEEGESAEGIVVGKPDLEVEKLPAGCFSSYMGSESSCKTTAMWQSYAASACKARGLRLVSVRPGTECGPGSYRFAKYDCCP